MERGSLTRSPSSSPSLAPVDSSPPSSPDLTALSTPPASPGAQDPFAGSTKARKRPRIYEQHGSQKSIGIADDCLPEATPTRPTRVLDPLSGSAKPQWRPHTYEKKKSCVAFNESATSASSFDSYTPTGRSVSVYASPTPRSQTVAMDADDIEDIALTDDESHGLEAPARPKTQTRKELQDMSKTRAGLKDGPKTRRELEDKLWDESITNAIDKGNGIIDLNAPGLGRGAITRIPPSIADLESFIVLHSLSSAPPSPTRSPTLLPSPSSSRPFTRATTLAAPVFDEPFFRSKDGERLRGTPVARAASLQAVAQRPTSQLRRREIHMFLANNSISKLPIELFRVTALTVLSLRSNKLTSIPPQITQLTALQELNLAQNKLRWLPAEMLDMRLTKLVVSGNPWLPPPSPQTAASSTRQGDRRPVSQAIVRFSIPPLSELCLRVLVSPYNPPSSHPPPPPKPALRNPHPSPCASSSRHPDPAPPSASTSSDTSEPTAQPLTTLEACYALPLTEDLRYSDAVLSPLRVCVPGAVSRPSELENQAHPGKKARLEGEDASRGARGRTKGDADKTEGDNADDEDVFASPRDEEVTGTSVCPSPTHRAGDGSSWRRGRVPVYVRHAEERWTWEEVVAGVRVATAEGGVPVRWRGCSRGCLAFLDPGVDLPASASAPLPAEVEAEAEMDEEGAALDLDIGRGGDIGGDVEMADVQAGLGDAEDFGEAF